MNPLLLEYLKTVVRRVYLRVNEMTLYTNEHAEIISMSPDMPGYADLREWVLRNFDIDDEGSYRVARYYEGYQLSAKEIEENLRKDKVWQ